MTLVAYHLKDNQLKFPALFRRAMTDNLHIPPRLEGEHARRSTAPFEFGPSDVGSKNLEQVSLETVIRVLLQRGLCTEAELLAEENRRRSMREPVAQVSNFTPVQIHRRRHRRRDRNRWRQWASRHAWSRKLGTLLFSWKWHRKKSEQQT